ncbi:unnamed protein product, partial [Ectocarpus fasciculatus]
PPQEAPAALAEEADSVPSTAATSAPLSSSSFANPESPNAAAKWSAVCPSPFAIPTDAPARSSACPTPIRRVATATCRAVSPSAFVTSGSAAAAAAGGCGDVT